MRLLRFIYQKLSRFSLIRKIGKKIYFHGFIWDNAKAYFRMKKQYMNRKKSNTIRVVFMIQNKISWDVIKTVYEKMMLDKTFDLSILTVKDFNETYNSSYSYFKKMYPSSRIIQAEEGQELFDLKSIHPDYVFIARPYDFYLPEQYKSSSVSAYARVCYCSYGFGPMVMSILGDCYSGRFFRNVAIFFAESEFLKQYNIRRFRIAHKQGVKKTVNCGYPSLDHFSHIQNIQTDSFNILWTPRWNDDKEMGGSSFFDYKDKIVSFIKDNKDLYLTFRPHPLLFDNFISKNKITREEADEYLNSITISKLMCYDNSSDYTESFANSDVLVTDPSSILIQYFMTEKPIIYCDTGVELDDIFTAIIDVNYIAKDFEEVKKYIQLLKEGHDPKKEARKNLKRQLFCHDGRPSADRFIEVIKDDYIH